jgi:Tol biopolymer transport system component
MLKFTLISCCLLCSILTAQAQRPIRPGDLYRLPAISDPQPSPDGKWISYTLTTIDSLKDSRNSDVWMISWDGTQDIQLTNSPDGESHARWSQQWRRDRIHLVALWRRPIYQSV